MPLGDAKSLFVTIGLRLLNFDQQLGKLQRSIGRTSAQLSSAGASLSKAITVPFVAAGVAAFKTSADFEDAFTKSTAIMGDLSDDMRVKMSDAAREMAKNTTFSAAEVAESFFFLASAGLSAQESLASLETVTTFATAGNFDLAKATDLLTDAQSALGLKSEDLETHLENLVRVSDVLVKANTLANASVEQFASALTNKAGGALRLVNKEIEEGVAVLAAFADQGVKGAEAGTKLEIVLRDLANTALDNKKKNREFFDSVFDTTGAMRNMADIIESLEERFKGMSVETKRSEIRLLGFQQRSVSALASLLGFSGAIRKYEKELKLAGGTSKEVAEKQLQSLSAQFKILKNRAADVAIELGQNLRGQFDDMLGVFNDLVDTGRKVVDWFGDLDEETKNAIVRWTSYAAAIGPVLLGLGLLGKALEGIIILGSSLTKVVRKLAAAIAFLATHPMVLLVTVAAAAGIALLTMSKETQAAEASMLNFATAVEKAQFSLDRATKKLGEQRKTARNLAEILGIETDDIVELRKAAAREITKLEAEFLRLSKIAVTSKSGLLPPGAFDVIKQIQALENSLKSLADFEENELSVAGDKVTILFTENAAQMKALEAQLKVTKDEQGFWNDRLLATIQLQQKLIPLLGENDDKVRLLSDGIQMMRKRIEELNTGGKIGEVFESIGSGLQSSLQKIGGFATAVQETIAKLGASLKTLSASVVEQKSVFEIFWESIQVTTRDVALAIVDVYEALISGIGDAVAQAIVFQKDFGQAMLDLLKGLLAQVISLIVQFVIKFIAQLIIENVAGLAAAAITIGKEAAIAGASAARHSVTTFGIAGIAAAPFFAAAAIAAVIGGAKAGFASGLTLGGAAEGGIFTRDGVTRIAEKGRPEIVLNESNIDRYFPGARRRNDEGGMLRATVAIDGRRVLRAIVPYWADTMREAGAT